MNYPLIDISDCYNYSDVMKKLKLPINGRYSKIAKQYIIDNNLSTSHFGTQNRNIKHKQITKVCPVCNANFVTQSGHKREKIVCSHSCSNTYFRSGLNRKLELKSYRRICFFVHKKECVICKENRTIEVHHIDENRSNNDPMNLVPLCPTHHTLAHSSKYRSECTKLINEYLKQTKFDDKIILEIRKQLSQKI